MCTQYPQPAHITQQPHANDTIKCFQIYARITPEGLFKDNLKDKGRTGAD